MPRRSLATGRLGLFFRLGQGCAVSLHPAFEQPGHQGFEKAGLALQLPFCFEVRTLGDRLVSSAPE